MGKEYVRNTEQLSGIPRPIEPFLYTDYDWDRFEDRVLGDGSYWVERDPTVFLTGRASLHMIPDQDGQIGDEVSLEIPTHMTESRYVEYLITYMPEGNDHDRFDMNFQIALSGYEDWEIYLYELMLDGDMQRFNIRTAAGIEVVENLARVPNNDQWYTLRMYIDNLNRQWVAAEMNGLDLDLSDYTYYSNPAGNPYNEIKITYVRQSSTDTSVYIDKVAVRGMDYLPI